MSQTLTQTARPLPSMTSPAIHPTPPFDEFITQRIQFAHPEKTLGTPVVNDDICAALFGIDLITYLRIKEQFAMHAARAAEELLDDAAFAHQLDQLPFQPNETIVAVGDSITDDLQSWFEILRHALAMQRPQDNLTLINRAVSGDTSTHLITRFLVATQDQPNWIFCFIGTNDARTHGIQPYKTLVSPQETARNLQAIRQFTATQTHAKLIWLTPATVIEQAIPCDWWLAPHQLMWLNSEMASMADMVRQQPEPVVDLQRVFGMPANPRSLLADGLHPSLEGQKQIVRAVVERLSQIQH